MGWGWGSKRRHRNNKARGVGRRKRGKEQGRKERMKEERKEKERKEGKAGGQTERWMEG